MIDLVSQKESRIASSDSTKTAPMAQWTSAHTTTWKRQWRRIIRVKYQPMQTWRRARRISLRRMTPRSQFNCCLRGARVELNLMNSYSLPRSSQRKHLTRWRERKQLTEDATITWWIRRPIRCIDHIHRAILISFRMISNHSNQWEKHRPPSASQWIWNQYLI